MLSKQVSRISARSLDDIKDMLSRGTSYSNILRRYPKLKSKSNIKNLKKYFDNDLPKIEKIKLIRQHIQEKFVVDRKSGIHVHEPQLQNWAIEGAEMYGVEDFRASHSFINRFKKINKYKSRKVTIVIPKGGIVLEEQKKRDAVAFVEDVKRTMFEEKIDESCVWNHDQSGIEYEMVGKRTISFQGKKKRCTFMALY